MFVISLSNYIYPFWLINIYIFVIGDYVDEVDKNWFETSKMCKKKLESS